MLGFGIKYPEIWGCVSATAGCPLPSPVIACQIIIQQFGSEVQLAPPPVSQKMFYQKGSCNHADPVVHESGLIQFSHASVYQRIAGKTLTPFLISNRVIDPFNPVIGRFKCPSLHMREGLEDHGTKIPPYELTHKSAIRRPIATG